MPVLTARRSSGLVLQVRRGLWGCAREPAHPIAADRISCSRCMITHSCSGAEDAQKLGMPDREDQCALPCRPHCFP